MARPRLFDRTKAVQQAMELFWRQGYEATSVQELGAALGLQPGSLYNTFKDKRSLFLETLDCYTDSERSTACQMLTTKSAKLAAIRAFFTAVIETDLQDADYKGCFMINSAAELASRDPDVRARVEASRSYMTSLFAAVLAESQQAGEISRSINTQEAALFLVNTLFGLRMTAKVLHDRQALAAIVDTALRTLA